MDPIYDRSGAVCAWIDADKVRDLRSGQVTAFVKGDNVHALNGAHLGWFKRGLFRDNRGAAVAWVEGAEGGPTKPVRQIKPIRPIRGISPIKPIFSIPPIAPISSLSWSTSDWSRFVGR